MATSSHCPPLPDTAPPAAGQVIRAATPASEGVWRRGHIPRLPSTVTSATESLEPYGAWPWMTPGRVWVIRYETPSRDADGVVAGTVPGYVWLRADEMDLV
ncbi:MAG: hypothetical protein JWN52_6631, partial [Actinomycetia bacterium]|nr:hypothetical protein [Actinomycetes bacterium]